jgi:hypothetical protein
MARRVFNGLFVLCDGYQRVHFLVCIRSAPVAQLRNLYLAVLGFCLT